MQVKNSPGNENPIDKYAPYMFAVICVIVLLIIRSALFYHEWGDYTYFYQHWLAEFREMTFIEGLGTVVGNYNPPHMYIYNILSRINFPELILLKLTSIIFDFLIAFFVMKIVSLKTDNINMRIAAFVLTLAIPTMILNGSMWAQCDSIYSAFAVGSIYFALSKRSKLAYIFIGIAFSFKMQSLFILPIFPVFIITKKIRFRDCYLFFVVYIAAILPAVLAGMSVGTIFSTYFDQVGTFSSLNMNIANIWRFVGNVSYDNFVIAGLGITTLIVLGLLYFTWVNRERLVSNIDFIRLAYLFAVIIPFTLPKMHDRYYFLADVLSLVVFLFDKRRWYVPVVSIFCSYLAYAWFLMGGIEIFDYRLGALALLAIILVVLRDYVISLRADTDSAVTDNNE
ncbi:MAG: hypothetical protein FWD38_08820 [Oscillospiraceae bacterium]|nr:hypothetical protein [Oscillospiraceae bacterium]